MHLKYEVTGLLGRPFVELEKSRFLTLDISFTSDMAFD